MARRLARLFAVSFSLAALAVLGGACSRGGKSTQDAQSSTPRPTAAVWADVLAQRDAMHAILVKPLEDVTHEDCAELGAAARREDALAAELIAHLGSEKDVDEGHLRAISDVVGRFSHVVAKIRETALAEAPGAFVTLRFPLDHALRDIETYFTADELGGQSVVRRQDFEAKPPPESLAPLSPI